MPNHDPPRFFLVDGYALIYRAFFAMMSRPLRTSRGENTSAAWGVANFLARLKEKYQPDYLAWINDAGDSFRTQVYPEYKSTREKLDEELQLDFNKAIARVRELLEAFRVPLVAIDGYEADDVIGTLAKQGVERDWQVVIVSGDKDFYQLIRPGVALLNPGRGGPGGVDEQWVDLSNATDRLGIPPSQVVDYLALVGDSSDNVPGVRGIGEKGAVLLLQEYGDLEALLAKAPEIKSKRSREALLTYAAEARLSRQLVTIQCDVPVEVDWELFQSVEPDREALSKILAELEFYTLANRLGLQNTPTVVAAAPEAPSVPAGTISSKVPAHSFAPPPVIAQVVTDPADLAAIVARLRQSPLVALDTESDGADPRDARLVSMSVAASETEMWYLPFGHRPRADMMEVGAPVENLPPLSDARLASLRELLQDPLVPKAGHDIKQDWQVLRHEGVELQGVVYDSMLASFVLDPGRRSHTLDTLSLEHFGRPMKVLVDLVGKGKTQVPFAEVAVSEAAGYCCAGSSTVLALHRVFAQPLREQSLEPLLTNIEIPLLKVLVDMEWAGIAIDPAVFNHLSRQLTTDLRGLESRIAQASGSDLNLNSPRQLAQLLFDKLQLPILKKTKTGPSTDADVLDQLAEMGHEVPRLIMEYRELEKLRSTYVDVLPQRVNVRTGRIHTRYNQTGAATGRLSSSEPNLQNIPIRTPRGEEIRRGFVPAPGHQFLVADYSQIELRLIAHLSEDPAFIQAFLQGGDIHRQTAAIIFSVPVDQVTSVMRGQAKTINFATIYGQGPFALARQLGIPQDQAKAFIAQYFERFSGVRAYLDRMVAIARDRGYVETIFGRRRYIPEIRDRNFNVRSFGERTAANSPVQGSAADLIKIAMRNIAAAITEKGLAARMLLQVHDELVFEVLPAEVAPVTDLVRDHMQGAVTLSVPLVVDIGVGPNWLDAKH
ncbi:MAG: DNA polymerase I [Gemmatimonadota bacterium]